MNDFNKGELKEYLKSAIIAELARMIGQFGAYEAYTKRADMIKGFFSLDTQVHLVRHDAMGIYFSIDDRNEIKRHIPEASNLMILEAMGRHGVFVEPSKLKKLERFLESML